MNKQLGRIITAIFLSVFIIGILTSCKLRFDIPADANPIIASYAIENNIPYSDYPESLIELLERNPETEDFVLNYPSNHQLEQNIDLSAFVDSDSIPLFLQWDARWGYLTYGSDFVAVTGCGPMCLSMVAFYLTGDAQYSPDKMIEFAGNHGYYSPGNGSSWTLISEGGKKLGFDVKELPLDKGVILSRLAAGEPIICVVGPGDFTTSGHFLVLTGIENGKIKVNDPNSIIKSNQLWSYEQLAGQIRNLWSIQNNR